MDSKTTWQGLLRDALDTADEAAQIVVLGELGRLLMGVLLKKVPSGTPHSQNLGATWLLDENLEDAHRAEARYHRRTGGD